MAIFNSLVGADPFPWAFNADCQITKGDVWNRNRFAERVDDALGWFPRPERDGVVTAKITGYSVKKDGTPGGGSRATTAIYVDLLNEWNANDYGLKWEVASQHYEEIRAIAERAIAEFGLINWGEVQA